MTTSVRVSDATRARAASLAAASGRSIGEVVEQALDAYERALFWKQTRQALATVVEDPDQDAAAWERTVRDGLDRD